ncbi:hypothetical protein WH47_11901 [Habropoda laboriosa]|uniref:Uncharacterized protein n=1 Tax=Habropoda laboriosa TaxID=597456 RepID=A0A0L7QLB0_9HYME|nr:hypothetical protein WH47_11901 [Habropoda laboriosa]
MGTRLRNARKTNKGIGGKGTEKLTEKVIAELTKYYGLAIRRNPNSVEEMRKGMRKLRKIVEIATFLAVTIFNEEFLPILKVMSVMGATVGQQAGVYVNSRNEVRITRSERRSSKFAKQARIDRREERAAVQDFFETEEGPLYGPGLAD